MADATNSDSYTTNSTATPRPLLGDSPVLESNRGDLLDFAPAAGVLAEAAVGTPEPLTIGIFGEWGTGKTSMMRLIKSKVEESPNAVAVWFNAWQYEKEKHLIVPLLATVINELQELPEKKHWSEPLKRGAVKVWKTLLTVASVISFKVEDPTTRSSITFSPKDAVKTYKDLNENTESIALRRSLYFEAFKELKVCHTHEDGCEVPRIVLFVDDLDRCFPNKAVELLEGIKLVLHQPGFSFVLGVNGEIIEAFVKTKYKKDFNIKGSHFNNYLDKIVQVKYYMPKHETGDMKEYIKALLEQVQIFPDDIVNDAIPLIAEACQHNLRSVVQRLNRAMVTHRIGEAKGKAFDPLLLLIHIATDEPHYKEFRKELNRITIVEAQEGQEGKEGQTKEIGQHVAEAIGDDSDNDRIKNRLLAIKMRSQTDKWNLVVDKITGNDNLLNVLKSGKGREWLEDSTLRRTLSKAAKSISGEKKTEAVAEKKSDEMKAEAATAFDFSGPIEALLMNMVKIPAGTFKMGGVVERNEQPIHEVRLQAFEIGATQVTQDQYEAIMGLNPSRFKSSANPVENVSWHDAKDFCRKLSEKANRTFTLPSEAQWEYACRAGSTGSYCFGDDEKELGEYAWYEANSSRQTHPVGEKKPNGWGLYDMHGNVWEWCLDHWHSDYNEAPDNGSARVTAEEGAGRVFRGGSWFNDPRLCRSAYRINHGPGDRASSIGFRVLAVLAGNK